MVRVEGSHLNASCIGMGMSFKRFRSSIQDGFICPTNSSLAEVAPCGAGGVFHRCANAVLTDKTDQSIMQDVPSTATEHYSHNRRIGSWKTRL